MTAAATATRRARAVADITEGTILASVEIAASPDRVFQAFTRPEELVKWWGSPETYRTTEWTGELRPGGRWKSVGISQDGSPFSVEGEYLEVAPPHLLVQTWKPSWDPAQITTTITLRIEAIALPGGASGARLTLRHTGFGPHGASCERHSEGWLRVLGWLSGHVAPAPERFFLCRLLPPRPTFMLDMTSEERSIMGEHVAYWTGKAREGTAVVFGPVADPGGGWGLGVVRVRDDDEVKQLEAEDPVIRAGRGFRYQVLPMPQAVTG